MCVGYVVGYIAELVILLIEGCHIGTHVVQLMVIWLVIQKGWLRCPKKLPFFTFIQYNQQKRV